MEFRRITTEDAKAFWQLLNQLDQETKFMLFEPEERQYTLKQAVTHISHSDFIVGAFGDGQLLGYLQAVRGKAQRIRHSAYIVTGILENYQHQGIGHQFFHQLDNWAKASQIKRLELTVMKPNEKALGLYQKSGFQIEGTRRQSMLLDGQYIDEFYMGKILQ